MTDIGGLIADRSASALTVAQLIERLSAIEDQSRPVWADGCDCSNPVVEVAVEGHGVTLAVEA